uniref:Hydrophobic seed protein domain-containing protein n=1 Tax=Oryza brachyantha TaxID=4533 RepID=J3NDC3_ORYBR
MPIEPSPAPTPTPINGTPPPPLLAPTQPPRSSPPPPPVLVPTNPPKSSAPPKQSPPPEHTPTPPPPPPLTPRQPPKMPPPPPSSGGQCPKEKVLALSICTKLDISTLLLTPGLAKQDCCPPIAGLSSKDATSCMCASLKLKLDVTVDTFFIETVLRLCGITVLGNLNCLL